MARTLKARKPDAGQVTKPKVLIFGPPNVGKTWVSLEFPKVYYMDTEGGASLPHYQTKLIKSGGVYFGKEQGSQDFKTVIDEIQALATLDHDYLTLVIDSFSKLYNIAAAIAENAIGNDFGKDKKEAQKPTRQLMMWLDRLDMNVVLICHAREKWARQGKQLYSEGLTFDGWEKMEYDLHLCLEISREGAKVHKTRLEGFPREDHFPWTFAEFEKRAGTDLMLRPPRTIRLAEKADIEEVRRLLSIVKMEPDWEEKVLTKAGVVAWEEMDQDKVQACIAMLSSRVRPVKPADSDVA